MSNSFQDQFLKAGLVTKKQVQKNNKANHTKKKQRSKKDVVVDESKRNATLVAQQDAARDRDLNKKKELQAQQKATSIEIDQLIRTNRIELTNECDVAYNFQHRGKIKRLYVTADIKQQLVKGKLGITRIDGRYEIVPKDVAEKIQQRNEKRVVTFEVEEQTTEQNDPYAEHQIPDDLMW